MLRRTYRITRVIGAGAMGTVFEARHVRRPDERVAIKLLHASVEQLGGALERFRREAELTSALGHPHIAKVLEFNQTGNGRPYVVMELLRGETLSARLVRQRRLSAADTATLLRQVGGALQRAHEQGVVHRDLKPDSIFLVGSQLDARVLDFGASEIRGKTVLTSDNVIFGTPAYMSPEQARGQMREVDHTTDMFALAVIAYELLSGDLPFQDPSIPGVLRKVCNEPPRPLVVIEQQLPGIQAALFRAMNKDKSARYARIEHLVSAVSDVLRGTPAGTEAPKNIPPTMVPPSAKAWAPIPATMVQNPADLAPPMPHLPRNTPAHSPAAHSPAPHSADPEPQIPKTVVPKGNPLLEGLGAVVGGAAAHGGAALAPPMPHPPRAPRPHDSLPMIPTEVGDPEPAGDEEEVTRVRPAPHHSAPHIDVAGIHDDEEPMARTAVDGPDWASNAGTASTVETDPGLDDEPTNVSTRLGLGELTEPTSPEMSFATDEPRTGLCRYCGAPVTTGQADPAQRAYRCDTCHNAFCSNHVLHLLEKAGTPQRYRCVLCNAATPD